MAPNIDLDPAKAAWKIFPSEERVSAAGIENFPVSCQVRAGWASLPNRPVVVLSIEVVEGRPVVTQVAIGHDEPGVELESRFLRSPSLPKLGDEAIKTVIAESLLERITIRLTPDQRIIRPTSVEEERQYLEAMSQVPQMRARRLVTDERLIDVANVYRANEYTGRPTERVGEELHTSHRNATRLVRMARDRGFLAPYGLRDK